MNGKQKLSLLLLTGNLLASGRRLCFRHTYLPIWLYRMALPSKHRLRDAKPNLSTHRSQCYAMRSSGNRVPYQACMRTHAGPAAHRHAFSRAYASAHGGARAHDQRYS